ncbi:MAG: AbgT family transporter [Clostridia bacterium]|nr:AbgT family transporter [Clostridia bacterium]
MSEQASGTKPSLFQRMLNRVEKICNRLPAPGILFLMLFAITAVLSLGLSLAGVTVTQPATGTEMPIRNFFSREGLYWFLENMIPNFTSFPPLGIVLVMTMAVGICEEAGLIEVLLRRKMKGISPGLLPYAVAFIGIIGNLASDTAGIIVPPMAGLLYLAAGRHPIAGMICGYAGVQAGFSANLMISGTDGLLSSITQKAVDAFFGAGTVTVDVACNWYFMAASTVLGTAVIGFVCDRLVDRHFGPYAAPEGIHAREEKPLTERDGKALRWAGISTLLFFGLIAAAAVWGPLGIIVGQEEAGTRGFVGSYLLKYLVTVLTFFFAIPGIVYGLISGSIKGAGGLYQTMCGILGRMGSYLAFCFFCAQFQQLFTWTRIDTLLAVSGANMLTSTGFTGFELIAVFILFSGFINIFISSASAKWAILAPVFIPMLLMAGGYHPAMTQIFYRIGDSATNAFTPVMPYLWVMLKNAQDMFDPDIRIGTFSSRLLPVGLIMLAAWIAFLGLWMLLGLPVGPGVPIHLPGYGS